MNLQELKDRAAENRAAGRDQWHGMSSAEIGRLNRAAMFGDNDEAFPAQWEWSRIVD